MGEKLAGKRLNGLITLVNRASHLALPTILVKRSFAVAFAKKGCSSSPCQEWLSSS